MSGFTFLIIDCRYLTYFLIVFSSFNISFIGLLTDWLNFWFTSSDWLTDFFIYSIIRQSKCFREKLMIQLTVTKWKQSFCRNLARKWYQSLQYMKWSGFCCIFLIGVLLSRTGFWFFGIFLEFFLICLRVLNLALQCSSSYPFVSIVLFCWLWLRKVIWNMKDIAEFERYIKE